MELPYRKSTCSRKMHALKTKSTIFQQHYYRDEPTILTKAAELISKGIKMFKCKILSLIRYKVLHSFFQLSFEPLTFTCDFSYQSTPQLTTSPQNILKKCSKSNSIPSRWHNMPKSNRDVPRNRIRAHLMHFVYIR